MKIVAFGEVMMRMMPPDHKLLTQSDTLEYLFTGTGVNVLSGLYQMQDETYLCTVLPDHAIGQAAAATIRKLGIHDDYLHFKGNHMGIYFLEKGFGVRPSRVTYLNRDASSFSQAKISDFDIDEILNGMDAIHICGIALAINENTRKLALAFAKKAKEKKIDVIFDCNYRPTLWGSGNEELAKQTYQEMLTQSDIVFAGEKDATLMFGITSEYDVNSLDYQQDILWKFRKMFDIRVIAGTHRDTDTGSLQGYLLNEKGFYQSRIHTFDVYDRIGGGDAFAAGMIHALYHMEDASIQVEYATCSGVLGHTTYGDSPVLSKQDILYYMEHGKSDVIR